MGVRIAISAAGSVVLLLAIVLSFVVDWRIDASETVGIKLEGSSCYRDSGFFHARSSSIGCDDFGIVIGQRQICILYTRDSTFHRALGVKQHIDS